MNDIEKEFLPYQQSLDMKELGFDKPCFSYYKNDKLSEILEEVINSKIRNVNNEVDDYISAPTFSQSFRFFREKFNLRSSVMDFIDDVTGIEWDYSIAIIGTDLDDKGNYVPVIDYSIDDPNRKYETYEEAELSCLIKLIEITKSGSLKA